MGAYIYASDHSPGDDHLVSGWDTCLVVVEMIQIFRERWAKERNKQFDWFHTPTHNPDEVAAEVVLAAHEEIPYQLEAYLTWVSNNNIRTALVGSMQKELNGTKPNGYTKEILDRARDVIRKQALAGEGLYLSL